MHLSLNEVEAQIRKAARGAGLPWGHAEEASRATRWLLAREIAVLHAAADLLDAHADGAIRTALDTADDGFRGVDGRLSPFMLGPALSDRAAPLAAGQAIAGYGVASPVFLAAFVANAARRAGRPLALAWPHGSIVLARDGAPRQAMRALAALESGARIVCAASAEEAVAEAAAPSWEGIEVDPALWERFDRLAAATYVPASAVSRERGAGAGAIDND